MGHRHSAMGQGDPLIPWGQRYGAALRGRRTNGAWGQRYGAGGPSETIVTAL